MLYVVGMSYMAAQHSAPLRSRRHTMMGGVEYDKGVLVSDIYFIGTTLLVNIHISFTQKWAGGHRCSYRHNVCRPATDAYTCIYNYKKRFFGGDTPFYAFENEIKDFFLIGVVTLHEFCNSLSRFE